LVHGVGDNVTTSCEDDQRSLEGAGIAWVCQLSIAPVNGDAPWRLNFAVNAETGDILRETVACADPE
jgi:hypothetical protein